MGRSVRVFKTQKALWDAQEIQPIVEQFKQYKASHNTPVIFGRDAPLVRPSDARFAGLHHLHLGNFNAINHQYHRTSDSWLIYATGFYQQNKIILIDILTPDAHQRANNIDLMNEYIKIANKFREQF